MLAGIGGATLDDVMPSPATTAKPPETPQQAAPEPAPPETSKEHEVSPPAAPMTPQPEPRGLGAAPPPVVTPGEVPQHERVKGKAGSKKPVMSKQTPKKRKEKAKTTTGHAKTAKGIKPQQQKTVKKPPATGTVEKSAYGNRPTPMGVTRSLQSEEAGRPKSRPEKQKRTPPSFK